MVRERVVSVRLTAGEFAAWTAAAGRSPFGSVARWCREAVAEAVEAYPVGSRTWAGARIPVVTAETVAAVVEACAVVNKTAMRSNRLGALVPETRAVLSRVVEVADSVPRIDAARNARRSGMDVERSAPRPHLVNVRVSAEELDAVWSTQARADGYARVSGWVRALVGSLLGFAVPPEPLAVPGEYVGLRRQLGGAITNLVQLRGVAELSGDKTIVWIDRAHAATQTALAGLYGPGGGR